MQGVKANISLALSNMFIYLFIYLLLLVAPAAVFLCEIK